VAIDIERSGSLLSGSYDTSEARLKEIKRKQDEARESTLAANYKNNPEEFYRVNKDLILGPKERGGWGLSTEEVLALFPHLANQPPEFGPNPGLSSNIGTPSFAYQERMPYVGGGRRGSTVRWGIDSPLLASIEAGNVTPTLPNRASPSVETRQPASSRPNPAAAKVTDDAVVAGVTAADNIQSTKAENNILAGLLMGNPRQSFEPSSGWDRLFKIMARMGATGGVSPIQDFIRGNIALTDQEALTSQQFADRQLKSEDLAQRRADQAERLGMERERLNLAKKTFDRGGIPEAPPLNSTTIEGMITVLETMKGQGQIDYDDLTSHWLELGFGSRPSEKDVLRAIAVAAISIRQRNPKKTDATAIKEAMEGFRTGIGKKSSSGSGSGAANIGAPVNINPDGEIKK